jgi:xylulokinase
LCQNGGRRVQGVYAGIDLGTSAVKAVLVDETERVLQAVSAPLETRRPRPLWSEQDPDDWWRATRSALDGLRAGSPREFAALRAIGLSGQMHGATLLDAHDRPLRPAILWNDGRSGAECAELERRLPALRAITGNRAMPGFSAPKLLWVAKHEPGLFARVARVLLPKDYVRLRLVGDHVSDLSDASGTLWLDVGRRAWSEAVLAACGLDARAMPRLVEGSASSGVVRGELAREWGLGPGVVVAGGGGDQAAGAIGVGVVRAGQAFVSLGTSGVLFAATDGYAPRPELGVHTFCHALPATWHQMSVILSAASALAWAARATGAADEAALLAEVEAADRDPGPLVFLPYLSGERTPHNDPHAKGVLFGLGHETTRADVARAVLEGVAFALADGQAALLAAGARLESVLAIGGGARSRLFRRIVAAALDRPLGHGAGAEVGPALGAARLARMAATGEKPDAVCRPQPADDVVEPEPGLRDRYREKLETYRRLYGALRGEFARSG